MSDDGPTFAGYLRVWISASLKGAWDTFGFVNLAVGAALWLWHTLSPSTFQRVASALGVSAETAMSDLVWQIPLVFGGGALGWRFLRAPYEIHLAALNTSNEKDAEIDDLKRRLILIRDRQKLLDGLELRKNTGAAILEMANAGRLVAELHLPLTSWERDTGTLIREHVGSDEYLRFVNAGIPVLGDSVSVPPPRNSADVAARLSGQLRYLAELSALAREL